MPSRPALPTPAIPVAGASTGPNGKISMPLSAVLSNAGWPANVLSVAQGVVIAESGGRVNVVNGGGYMGLFQIGSMHKGQGGASSDPATFRKQMTTDPIQNARTAKAIYDGAGGTFQRDWEAYQNKSYLKYVGKNPMITWNQKDIPATNGGGPVGAVLDAGDAVVNTVTGPLDAIKQVVNVLFSASTWFRVGKVLLGVPLLIIGLVYLAYRASGSPSASQIASKLPQAKVARKVIPK